jgi:hypothetical protein
MKNIEIDSEDSPRPEYKRSDFGEFITGKYATTQVGFHQLTEALLACIGEDECVRFMHHSTSNRLAGQKPGDWTYEIDDANQITLRYWLSEFVSIKEAISNPPCAMTGKDRTEFQDALLKGVTNLKAKPLGNATDWSSTKGREMPTRRNSAEVFEWFRQNRKALLANDYTSGALVGGLMRLCRAMQMCWLKVIRHNCRRFIIALRQRNTHCGYRPLQ